MQVLQQLFEMLLGGGMRGVGRIQKVEVRGIYVDSPDVSHLLGYFTGMSEKRTVQEIILSFQSQVHSAAEKRTDHCRQARVRCGYRLIHIA